MNPGISNPADTEIVVRIRMRLAAYWAVMIAGIGVMIAMYQTPSIPKAAMFVAFLPFAWAGRRLRDRSPKIPELERRATSNSKSFVVWAFVFAIVVIGISGFALSREQHNNVIGLLVIAFFLWLFVFDVRVALSPHKFVKDSQGADLRFPSGNA